jgi:hypothetical protein
MDDVFSIRVMRDGKALALPLGQCTKREITEYFDALEPEELKACTFLLLGMAFGYASRIEDLERQLASFKAAL